MGIIHSNKYAGFSTSHLEEDSSFTTATGLPYTHNGFLGPIWTGSYNTAANTNANAVNVDHMWVGSTPDYKLVSVASEDQETIGSSTEYRRHKAHRSPTGSPYLYNSGDTFSELKPIKTHWSWRDGDYGHGALYKNHSSPFLGLYDTDSGNFSMARDFFGLHSNYGFEEYAQHISPHWMLGFALAQSGQYCIASHPHSCGSGSTTTTEPDGFGGLKQLTINGPYMHLDPDKTNTMQSTLGVAGTPLGNVQLLAPRDGVLSVEYCTMFTPHEYSWSKSSGSSWINKTVIAAQESCISNLFGPFFPSSYFNTTHDEAPIFMNDVASVTGFNTTPTYPHYYSKAWTEAAAAVLPPPINGTSKISRYGGSVGIGHSQREYWGPSGQSWSHPDATFVGFHTDISGNQNAQFGYSLDIADGFLIAGAPGYYGGVNSERADRGAIGVYIRPPQGGQNHIASLNFTSEHVIPQWTPYSRREGEQPGDRFGHAVACGYNRYIVGAPGFNEGQGKAYLYADIWREHEAGPSYELLPDNDPTLHYGTWIYSRPATAARAASTGISSGPSFCKHAQRLYGLKLIKELTPVGAGQSYGYAVSVGNGRIAVSNLAGAGSVEIFNLEGNRIGILTAPDGQTGDCFGRSVEINQGIIAVGAPHATVGIGTTNVRCGAVYAFDRNRVSSIHQVWRGRHRDNEGNQIRPGFLWKQHPPDGADGDRFGDSLSIGSGRVLVGAPYKSHFETPSADGSAYNLNLHGNVVNVLTAASWRERPENSGRFGPGIRTDSHFGHAVSINGHHAVISAPFHGEWIEGSVVANSMGYSQIDPDEKEYEESSIPDNLFFFTTPQCITVWDAIDNNHGKL